MKYYMEIYIMNKSKVGEWKRVKPTSGIPYEYDSPRDTFKMLDLCYGDGSCYNPELKYLRHGDVRVTNTNHKVISLSECRNG